MKNKSTSDRPVVEIVDSAYQPKKAELEEPVRVPKGLTPEDVGRALLRPVNVRRIPRPRR